MFTAKAISVCVFFLLFTKLGSSISYNSHESGKLNTINEAILAEDYKRLTTALNKTLDFINEFYYEMNIDGALGIILAEAQLHEAFKNTVNKNIKSELLTMIKKCQIYKKIKEILPQKLHKHVLFKHYLLNPNAWENDNNFVMGFLQDRGVYSSWTVQDILRNRSATFNGVASDECLTEILEQSSDGVKQHLCYVSSRCRQFMFEEREDTGYVLTHRLLYIYVWRISGCIMDKNMMENLIRSYCSLILKEVKTNAVLGYPQHDIFLEQVVLCGMEGFIDLLRRDWMKSIIEWQAQEGCYRENKTYNNENIIESRSANVITFGCTNHATGLGAAALAVNLRYILWRLEYFKHKNKFDLY